MKKKIIASGPGQTHMGLGCSVYLRIEIHILSLHWIMKNINYFNGLLRNIKIAHVFHHPV